MDQNPSDIKSRVIALLEDGAFSEKELCWMFLDTLSNDVVIDVLSKNGYPLESF